MVWRGSFSISNCEILIEMVQCKGRRDHSAGDISRVAEGRLVGSTDHRQQTCMCVWTSEGFCGWVYFKPTI